MAEALLSSTAEGRRCGSGMAWVLGHLFSFSVNYLLILHLFSAIYFLTCVIKTINIHIFRNK